MLSPLRRLRFLWDRCDGARASRFSVGLDDGGSPNVLVVHIKSGVIVTRSRSRYIPP